jgi:membrane-bound metal-dependent hydrolase YbcI (DUF457 family)
MATPIGHALVGLTLARRLGVRSPAGMAAATVAAGLPDADVLLGLALHGDPWKLHKRAMHTMGFALASGMLSGLFGLVRAGSADGERDLIADSLAGALLVGSHIVLDRLPLPYLRIPEKAPARERLVKSVYNFSLDGVVYGYLASKLWPRDEAPA